MADDIDIKQTLFLKPMVTRRVTDKFFILLLPLNLLLCLLIGVNALLEEKLSANIWRDLSRFFTESIVYEVIAILIIILFVVIFNKLKDVWLVFVVTFSIVSTILSFIACILWQLFTIPDSELNWWLFLYAVICITYLVYNVTIFICTKEFDVATLGPIIKEPIQAILQSYTVSLFSLAIIFLMTIIFVITFPAAICAANLYLKTRHGPIFFIRLSLFTFIFGGTFIIDFIWNFGFMVMGDYFANYYGRHNVSKTYIFQSIATVSRYHLGTVAFLSTPILPCVCASIMTSKNNQQRGKPSDYKLINFISKISLIMNMPEYALIQTSIFGSKSLKSIRHMVDLRHKNSLLFLTLNAVSIKMMDLSMTIAIIIIWIVIKIFGMMEFYINPSFITSTENVDIQMAIRFLTLFYVIWFSVNTINMLLLRPAACTFAICKMIDGQHESKTSGEQTELTVNGD